MSCGPDGGRLPTGPGGGTGDDTGIFVVSGTQAPLLPGETLSEPVVIRLVRSGARPVVGIPIEIEPEPGSGVVSPRVVVTDLNGQASFRWRLGGISGLQTARLSAPSVEERGEARVTTLEFPPVDALRAPHVGPLDPVGALIDGQTRYGDRKDLTFVGQGPVLGVGDWRAPGLSGGEVTVFVPGFGMTHRRLQAWTSQPDSVDLTTPDPATIPVTVWIVEGPFGTRQADVEQDLDYANLVFEQEGLGVFFEMVEVIDRTDIDPDSPLLDFVCGQRSELQEQVGERPGTVNVYIVRRVDGVRSRGQACEIGGDFVVLGGLAGPTLLAHELGHNLGLVHPDFDTRNFDQTNIMHSASDTRDSLTEGQIFRAHLTPESALNSFTGLYAPDELRNCPFTAGNEDCPPFQMRLFPDGPFAAFLHSGPAHAHALHIPEISLFEHALLVGCGLDHTHGTALRSLPPRFDRDRLERALEEGPPPHLLRMVELDGTAGSRARRAMDVTWRENAARALAALPDAR